VVCPGPGRSISEIQAREKFLYLKDTLNSLMAEHHRRPLAKIAKTPDRDYFLSPPEAVAYGLIRIPCRGDETPADAETGGSQPGLSSTVASTRSTFPALSPQLSLRSETSA